MKYQRKLKIARSALERITALPPQENLIFKPEIMSVGRFAQIIAKFALFEIDGLLGETIAETLANVAKAKKR